MSSKTTTIPQSRIINTNSLGIVTIVIDDDSDSVPKVTSSVPSRPAIAVRNPVSVQSPKFVNSDNQQRIIVNENKSNIILVNSNPKIGYKTPIVNGSTSLTSSSSSSTRVSSQALPTELKSQHNHVERVDTHYVVINKPNKHLPNTTVTSTSSSSSSALRPSLSPPKYRLWTQQQSSNQSFSRSASLRPSLRTRERVLPPEDPDPDCMDDQTFFKYLNLIPANEYKAKPKIDLKVNWPLRNIAKISKPETNTNGNILMPNLKLIRSPMTQSPDLTHVFNERKMQWYRSAQHYNERLQKFKANLPPNPVIRDRIQTDLENLHKSLMAEKQKQNEEEEKYRKSKSIEQRKRLQIEEQKQELEVYTNVFEWTSLMGKRVRDSAADNGMSAQDVSIKSRKIEEFCSDRTISSVNVPQSGKSSTRITRSNTGFAGIDKMWGPRSESHEYCFNRRQRLEKYRRLETGLNWKSRIIAMQLKPVDVGVVKITRCPCCLELVEPEWGHSCRDSDDESNQVDVMSINDSELELQSNNNDEEASVNSEIITAGNVICFDCGSEECEGNCGEETTTPVTKISITDTPILVFASNETIVPLKPKIEDKMMVQKVPVLHDNSNSDNKRIECNVQRRAGPKSRTSNQKKDVNADQVNDDDDNDIVIIQEVVNRPDSQCHNEQKQISEPVIIRYSNPSDIRPLRPALKRKYCVTQTQNSPQNSCSDNILVKKV